MRCLIPLSTRLKDNRGVEKYVKELKRVKTEVEILEKAGSLSVLLYLIRNRVDVILYQDPLTLLKTFPLAKLWSKKIVIVLHNVYHVRGGIKFRILGFLLQRVDHVICVSEFVKEELESLKNKVRVSVVGEWLDLKEYRPLNIERERNSVLFVGYLAEEKGILEFLRASARLKGFKFYVIGDGPLKDKVRCSDVVYLGKMEDNELIYWYNRVELVVVPTVYKHEGFNRVAMEAMACGANVLVSENVPCPAPNDSYILARAIEVNLKEGAREGIREFAEQKFSERLADQIEDILEETCQ